MEEGKLSTRPELLLIGGSAGAFNVLLEVIPKITSPLKFAILIVLHRKSGMNSDIAAIFSLRTKINVLECEDKEAIEMGNIYFAPPDYHLLIEKEKTFSLDYSEKVNYSRPSIDVTFKVAADLYEGKLAAILLSGANNDGAEGLSYIQTKSGTTIVQDPSSAESNTMPAAALKIFKPDFIADVAAIVKLINSFNTQ